MITINKNCVDSQYPATYTASKGEVRLYLQGNDIRLKRLGGAQHSNANVSCDFFKDNNNQIFNSVKDENF